MDLGMLTQNPNLDLMTIQLQSSVQHSKETVDALQIAENEAKKIRRKKALLVLGCVVVVVTLGVGLLVWKKIV